MNISFSIMLLVFYFFFRTSRCSQWRHRFRTTCSVRRRRWVSGASKVSKVRMHSEKSYLKISSSIFLSHIFWHFHVRSVLKPLFLGRYFISRRMLFANKRKKRSTLFHTASPCWGNTDVLLLIWFWRGGGEENLVKMKIWTTFKTL